MIASEAFYFFVSVTPSKGYKDGFKQNNLNLTISGKITPALSYRAYNQISSYTADLDANGFTDARTWLDNGGPDDKDENDELI